MKSSKLPTPIRVAGYIGLLAAAWWTIGDYGDAAAAGAISAAQLIGWVIR